MTSQINPESKFASHPLAIINELIVKANKVDSIESLQFIILNDTHELLKYDRAILWKIEDNKRVPIGISGQAKLNTYTELYQDLLKLGKAIADPSKPQLFTQEYFSKQKEVWKHYQGKNVSTVLWLPIFFEGKMILGLWLEQWNIEQPKMAPPEIMDLLTRYLLPGYGVAWEKKEKKYKFYSRKKHNLKLISNLTILSLLLLSFFIRVPLRVSAPCEVVVNDPYLITAPINGIIEKVVVTPGTHVKKGELLVEYNKKLPLQDLKLAQSNVDILQAEVNRAMTMQVQNKILQGDDLGTLQLKLKKEKKQLELAEYRVKLLSIKSPIQGTIILDDPDKWSGKPVQVGDKILTVADITRTKVKIWVAENDNIPFELTVPMTIYLNRNPEIARQAKITYIANETSLSPGRVSSFVVDGEWIKPQEDVKPGLKGTAILYGKKVSIFYYIFRKPWAFIHHLFGF